MILQFFFANVQWACIPLLIIGGFSVFYLRKRELYRAKQNKFSYAIDNRQKWIVVCFITIIMCSICLLLHFFHNSFESYYIPSEMGSE